MVILEAAVIASLPSTVLRLSAWAIACVAMTLGAPAWARADIITVNFADYPLGTDLSTVFQGVTVRVFSNNPGDRFDNPVYSPAILGNSLGGFGIHTGDVLDYEDCISGRAFYCTQGYVVFEMLFDTPTDFVSIYTQRLLDYPTMLVYDELGNRLARCVGGGVTVGPCDFSLGQENGTFTTETFGFRSESSAISRVLFGGAIGVTTIGAVSYSVPEPTTLGFVSLGALCGALMRRRRERQPNPVDPSILRAR